MRPRNREINIFNMSLLDILCGALGAFCFMMLVLLPYYKPGRGGTDDESRKEREETLEDIEDLMDKLKDAELAKQLKDLVKQLEAQIKELEGEVNSLTMENDALLAENEELDEENERLDDENFQLQDRVDMQEPIVVLMWSNPSSVSIRSYVYDDNLSENKNQMPVFDPSVEDQGIFWSGDKNIYRDSGFVAWLKRDLRKGHKFKIYVKVKDPRVDKAEATISATVFGPDVFLNLPKVTLTPERWWTLIGTLTALPEKKREFKEATAEEREAEWKLLHKDPPAEPTPPPEPKPETPPEKLTLEEKFARLDLFYEEKLKGIENDTSLTPEQKQKLIQDTNTEKAGMRAKVQADHEEEQKKSTAEDKQKGKGGSGNP